MAATKAFVPRFVRPPKNAEPPEWYEIGGFCPVRLNQCFADRYRVLRKLGWGTCATVWLAKDDQLDRYVALKIGRSTGCRLGKEIEALQKTKPSLSSDPKDLNTLQLLDAFQHTSPNGVHQALVLEPLGRSLERMILLQSYDATFVCLSYLKNFVRQLLVGLGHIHASGVVHRDIQPGNILFAKHDGLADLPESELAQHEMNSDDVLKLEKLDKSPLDEHTPPYLVNPWPLGDDSLFRAQAEGLRVVITDFGAASSFEEVNDGYHAYPAALRPPELVLKMPMTAPQADIWSLGCVIYQAATSRRLFDIDGMSSRQEQDDEYLQSITEVMGPLPKTFLNMWERRAAFVDEEGILLEAVVDEGISEPLSELVSTEKPEDMDDADAAKFTDFLRSMLCVEPMERRLTPDLLRHPWLDDLR